MCRHALDRRAWKVLALEHAPDRGAWKIFALEHALDRGASEELGPFPCFNTLRTCHIYWREASLQNISGIRAKFIFIL